MKKFKKLVALVMVVAMFAGLFTFIGPAALADMSKVTYNDHADINEDYENAVQLFSKMRVIEGENNSLAPKRGLSRAEAAAIIARTLISREAADILGTNVAPFSDVPASHWAAGAVAFAQNRGLIAGIGGGEFAPGLELTKAQWLKILLCAIGYGANGEFEGTGWAARVFEAATNPQVDLFGRYDTYMIYYNGVTYNTDGTVRSSQQEIRIDALEVSEVGLDAPIPREEAIALLHNAVITTRKVVYNRAYDIYTPATRSGASAGLSGADYTYILNDIALRPWHNRPRDNYGRPYDWTIDWGYRNEWIYAQPDTTPQLLASYKGAQTGTQLRQALQGWIGNLTNLNLTETINLFTNGHFNESGWWNKEEVSETSGSSTVRYPKFTRFYADDPDDDNNYEFVSSWRVLERYLTARGNAAAFGPAVTVEVYEYSTRLSENKRIDVVIIAPYLTELTRKVSDDRATLLIDETSLQFNVFNTATGTQLIESQNYIRRVTALTNFKELYDDTPVNSYLLTTPYVKLSPAGNVGFIYANGSLFYIKPPTTPSGDTNVEYRVRNETLRSLNEVYEAANTVSGVATSISSTRIAVAGASYNRALLSPTVTEGDFSTNYTYYLDKDNVVIGAVYNAPGVPTMQGFLMLEPTSDGKNPAGSPAGASITEAPWAKALVTLATGRSLTVDLLTTTAGGDGFGRVWSPDKNGYVNLSEIVDIPGYSSITAGGRKIIDGFDNDFYAYTIVGGAYRLSKPDDNVFKQLRNDPVGPGLVGRNINISRGNSRIGYYGGTEGQTTGAGGGTLVTATTRTILTVVDSQGSRSFTGFDRFPNNLDNQEDGYALVRLEPNSNRAAEILYVNITAGGSIPATAMFAYIVEESIDEASYGRVSATFIADDGNIYPNLIINNTKGVEETKAELRSSRFFELVDLNFNEEWQATPIFEDVYTTDAETGDFTLKVGYATGSYVSGGDPQFELGDYPGVVPGEGAWIYLSDTGTQFIRIKYGEDFQKLGIDAAALSHPEISSHNLIVVIYGGQTDDQAKVAFVFDDLIGRGDIPGVTP